MIPAVTDGEFEDKVIQSSKPVIVDFWAAWCGPCKALSPVLEELATENSGKVDFYKLNIDENAETTTKYAIKGIPTLLLFKDGKIIDQLTGNAPKSQLQSLLEKGL